jgi:GcrA cell cycle regulator
METVWTQERIEQLGQLWAQGLSTAEIGRRLGLTKNAVVGKAHRLSLNPRPSPLKAPPQRRRIVVDFSGPSCSWPIGHPGEKTFHFCGGKPVAGKPYCAEHAALAYIRPKERNSNAA